MSVTIGGNVYEIYGSSAGYDIYWGAGVGPLYDAWLAADATKRNRSLVEATRLLDRQQWQGQPVGVPVIDVVLQWPRTGVVDASGEPVSELTVPDAIVKGCYELAASLLANPSLMTASLSGANVQRVKAGPVEVEFFSSTLGISGVFPQNVADLVGQFLAGARTSASGANSQAFGTDEESQFDTSDTYVVTS